MIIKSLLVTIAVLIGSFSVNAQRVAVVDITSILENLESYQAAQNKIDGISAKWRQEIAQEYDKIKSLYNKYQAEQVLLSDDVRTEREEEIMAKEKEAMDLNDRRFGAEGDLFRERQQLISPIQDEVFSAIEQYAKIKGYDLIFDKSAAIGLLYANDEFDKTAEIKRELGIRN